MKLTEVLTRLFILTLLGYALLLFSCNSVNPSSFSKAKTANDLVDKLKIEYLAHASFRLIFKEHSLLLDPFADAVWISYSFPKNIEADAIFSTHPHYDHDGGIFRDLKPYWQGKIPFYQDPGTYQIGAFKIEGLKGKHCEPYGKEFGQKNTIFIFEVAGLRIAHWGDNEPLNNSIAAGLTDIDILMLPIDDSYHILTSNETAAVIQRVNPKIIIPMHYKIAALEPTPGKPKNLETVDKYLSARENVVRLKGNTIELSKTDLPKSQQYFVFEHSPLVK